MEFNFIERYLGVKKEENSRKEIKLFNSGETNDEIIKMITNDNNNYYIDYYDYNDLLIIQKKIGKVFSDYKINQTFDYFLLNIKNNLETGKYKKRLLFKIINLKNKNLVLKLNFLFNFDEYYFSNSDLLEIIFNVFKK